MPFRQRLCTNRESKNIDFPLLGHIHIKHHQNWNRDKSRTNRSRTDEKQKLTCSHVSSCVATHPHVPPRPKQSLVVGVMCGLDFAVAVRWVGSICGPIQSAWTVGQLDQRLRVGSSTGLCRGSDRAAACRRSYGAASLNTVCDALLHAPSDMCHFFVDTLLHLPVDT